MGNTVKMYTLRRRGHCIFSIFFGCIKERPWYLLYNGEKIRFGHIRCDDKNLNIHCIVCIPLCFGWAFPHRGGKVRRLEFA